MKKQYEQPVEIVRRYVRCDPYVIHYRQAGPERGVPIVLVHGLAVSSDYLQPIMRSLAELGFSVFAPDLPGHGFSTKPRHALTVPQAAEVLNQWICLLGLYGKLHLAGHSMGGQIAVEAIVSNPGIARSLTLISATGGRKVRPLNQEIFGLLLDAFQEKPAMVGLAIRNYFKAGALNCWNLAQHHIQDNMCAKLGHLDYLPVLVVWAERDKVAPLSFGKELHRQLRRSCLAILSGSSHAGLVYTTPNFLAQVLYQFVEEPFMQHNNTNLEVGRRLNNFKARLINLTLA